jgi:diguanylate cyclase (GGDEF)-like protein/PAS domain S-box-containing protein
MKGAERSSGQSAEPAAAAAADPTAAADAAPAADSAAAAAAADPATWFERASIPANGFERAVIDSLYDGVYYVDRGRRIRYWNAGAERLTGYAASAVVGRFCHDNLLNHVDATGRQLCRSGCPLAATMGDGQPREAEVFLHHRAGHRVPVRVRAMPVRDRDGTVIGAVEIFDDSTALSVARREVSELRDLAMHDALTGLPNRRHFEMSMASRIAELAGYGRRFGLLIADIDRFKLVNDRHGHAIGDVALRTVARTLLESSRAGDDIARFGGEEFALTITDVDEPALRAIAERFRALVQRSRVRAGQQDLLITISIGGTVAGVGDTAEAIFQRADAALYRAKESGRNCICLHGDAGAAGA